MKRTRIFRLLLLGVLLVGATHFVSARLDCASPSQLEGEALAFRRPIRLRSGVGIMNIVPSTGSPSDGVTLNGWGFTSATSVNFNGTNCSFVVLSSTQIAAIVPNGATTGPVHVVTPNFIAKGASFTIVSGFAFDFTTPVLPSGIDVSRTGGDIYAERTPSTVVKYSTGTTQGVYECGDNGACGWRTFGAYTNYATAPFDFSNVFWQHDGTPTIVPNDITSPDGVTLADRVTTPLGEAGLFSGPVGPSNTNYVVTSLWSAASAGMPPSPEPGVLAIFNTYGASGIPKTNAALTTGTSWSRFWCAWNKGGANNQYIRFAPAGAIFDGSNNVTFDPTATGGIDAWGAMTTQPAGLGINPLLNGTTSALVMDVNPSQYGNLLHAGDFHLEGAIWMDQYFTDGPVAMDATSPYYFDMVDAVHGNTFVRWGSQYVIEAQLNSTGTVADLNIGPQFQGTIGAAELKWELWSRPSDSSAGFQVWVNGARSAVAGTISMTAQQMFAPTAMYLGSNSGTGGWLDRRHTLLRTTLHNENAAEGLVFGDSLTAQYTTVHTAMATWLYNLGQIATRPGIVIYAYPGETVAQQKTRYDAAPQKGQSYITWIYVLVGVNNVLAGDNAATVTTALQSLISDINAGNPTAKVLLAPITPCKGNVSIGASGWATITTINDNIAGTGGSPITGSNLIRLSYWNDLDAGYRASGTPNGILYGPYDSGDGLHQNNPGMLDMSATVRSTLVSNGLLN